MSLYLDLQIVASVGVVAGIVLFMIRRHFHKPANKTITPGTVNPEVPKDVVAISKKHNIKITSSGLVLTRFVPKHEMEDIKQELLPFGFVWDEQDEKFIQTAGLSSMDAKSIIEVFDLFDERMVKLEKAVLGSELSNVSVSLPPNTIPLLQRMKKVEESLSTPIESEESKIKEKKEEIDLSFFSQPRTTDEIVQKFNFQNKQGLYMKLTAYGIQRNGDGNYYLPEKN